MCAGEFWRWRTDHASFQYRISPISCNQKELPTNLPRALWNITMLLQPPPPLASGAAGAAAPVLRGADPGKGYLVDAAAVGQLAGLCARHSPVTKRQSTGVVAIAIAHEGTAARPGGTAPASLDEPRIALAADAGVARCGYSVAGSLGPPQKLPKMAKRSVTRSSHVIPQRSTNRAQPRLTSEF
jgi:hypothetical protein